MFKKLLERAKGKKAIITLALLTSLGAGGYKVKTSQDAIKKAETATVKQGTLKETLTVSGEINAEEIANLRFQTSGRLAWVGVKEGDVVKKGQVLATLDQRDLKKNLQKDLNSYMKERHDFDQDIEDYDVTVVEDSLRRIVDKAQLDLNSAVIDVELEALTVEYSRLASPIDGIVTFVEVSYPGVNITPATSEFTVINPHTMYFEAVVDQAEITKLKVGMKGLLVLDPFLEEELQGTISYISFVPKSGETGTVYTVKFAFNNSNNSIRYRLGMTGDLDFIIQEKENALYIPLKYLNEDEEEQYVFILKNGKKTKKTVKTGLETDEFIEITEGVTKGNTVYD